MSGARTPVDLPLLVDGIKTAFAKGIASQNAPDSFQATLDDTVLADSLVGIFGACRVEPATWR
jgi:hypothetical protein